MIRPGVRRLFHLGLRRADAAAEDTRAEIEAHLAARAEQLERQGLSPAAARAEAARRFGPRAEAEVALQRAARRRERRLGLRDRAEALVQDLRYTARSLRAEPATAMVVVLLVALGVGANAAMFGILDRLLLSGPANVREPQAVRRVFVTADVPAMGTFTGGSFGYVAYTTLRDATRALAGVGAYSYSPSSRSTLGAGDEAEQVQRADATWDLFPLLGTRAALGRFFDAREDRPGAAASVVVLGDALWRRRFAADPGVLGRRVVVDGTPLTVIGIAPPRFTGAELGRVDVWLPMSLRGPRVTDDWQTTWDAQWLRIVVRLAPGVTPERAADEATHAFRAAYRGSEEPLAKGRLSLRPLTSEEDGNEPRELAVARWAAGVSLLVLLVACANVANLLLARAVRRRREVAIRVALGISGMRLLRLMALQSLLLAAAGGAAALALVPATRRLVGSMLLPDVDWSSAALDGRVVAVALVLTLLAALAGGLLPAMPLRRGALLEALKSGTREGGGRSSRLRTLLTVAQAALSVVLLVGAGLFLESLARARAVDLGIEPGRVLTVEGSWPRPAPGAGEDTVRQLRQRRNAFYHRALDRVEQMPGVASAAIAVGTPFSSSFTLPLRVPGRDAVPQLAGGGPYIQAVTSGYFPTMGLRLLRGRLLAPADREGSEAVAVVNRTMARTLWPAREPLGQCLLVGAAKEGSCTRVVGVVEDAHRFALDEPPAMQYYVPLGQEEGIGGARLLVRPGGELAPMVAPLRRVLRPLDPGLLWLDVRPFRERTDALVRPWRLGALLVGVLGGLALLIAAVGLYSLMAHLVASRAHELGVRAALGAGRGALLALVVREGLVLATAGLLAGVAIALGAAPFLGGLLYRTSPRDPLVYAGVLVTLLAAALLACLLPARRALGVDPATVLRDA